MRRSLHITTALGTSLLALVPGATAVHAQSHDWSGFYIGGSIGIVQDNATGTATYPDGLTVTGASFSGGDLYVNNLLADSGLPTLFTLDSRGTVLGLQAGYNFMAGSLVLGVEGDFRLLGNASTSTSEVSTGGLTTVTLESDLTSLATLRARAGVSADRLLLFATAGLATGHSTLATDLAFSDVGKSASLSGTGSEMQFGFVAGAGAEYAVSDRISIKGEALYYDLGSASATADEFESSSGGITTATPYTATVDRTGVIVSTGINFRF